MLRVPSLRLSGNGPILGPSLRISRGCVSFSRLNGGDLTEGGGGAQVPDQQRCPIRTCAALSAQSAPPVSSPECSRPSSAIRKIQRDLESGAKSAVDVAEEYLQRLQDTEGVLGSFLHHDAEKVLDQARQVDILLRESNTTACVNRPLLGVPLAVKDNICTRDMPSTAGSRILEGYVPPYDATAVKLLRSQGAVLVGKTNMDEFGMGSSSEQSAYKATRNPWAYDRVPGGSSGGSAAAVAAGQCAAALGSDTGGSVRQPASFCGVVGLKPTYGRVSRFGLIAYASSLDVIGCMAPSVEDAALLLSAIAGHDAADSTSSKEPIPDFSAQILPPAAFSSRPLQGVRLGLVRETLGDGVAPAVTAAITGAALHLEALGATITEVSLPSFPLGLPAYYILAASEASSNLSRYDGLRYGLRVPSNDLSGLYCASRAKGFGDEVKRRILMGTYALSAGFYDAYYKRAQQIRTLVLKDFNAALETNHALITPTTPTPAFKLGEKTKDPLAMYAGDLMTVNVNLAGLPALSILCGWASAAEEGGEAAQLPVGLQLIGRGFQEADILRIGHVFEQTTDAWLKPQVS